MSEYRLHALPLEAGRGAPPGQEVGGHEPPCGAGNLCGSLGPVRAASALDSGAFAPVSFQKKERRFLKGHKMSLLF